MAFWILVSIVAAGLLLNVIVRRLVRAADRELVEDAPQERVVSCTLGDATRILNRWGTLNEKACSVPRSCMPAHSTILELLLKYREVNFDGYIFALDSKLLRLYELNSQFVVMGDLGEGSLVMFRRDEHDPCIYLAAVEDADPLAPTKLAGSLIEYLCLAEKLYFDCLRE